jgi:predicted dehydrogenase
MIKVTNVGIIGAGDITRQAHISVLKSFTNVHIAWIADTNPKRTKTLGHLFNIDQQIVLNGKINPPSCDVVLLATPIFARKQYLEYFGSLGVVILTEKPFAISHQEHLQFLELCPKSQIHCGFMRRAYSTVRALRQMIHGKWFGELHKIQYSEGGRVTKAASSSKTLDMSYRLGGGVLRDLGCHALDTLLYITRASGFNVLTSNIEWDQETDRQVVSEFILSGINGNEHSETAVSYIVSWLTPQNNSMLLEFDNARVRVGIAPENELELQGISGGDWIPMSLDLFGARSFYQAFYLEWENVLSSIYNETESEFAAASFLLTTRLVDEIYKQGGGQ